MRRKLFNLATAVSLVMCVATVVIWVLSYFTSTAFAWSDGVRVPTAGYQIAWRKVLIVQRGRVNLVMDRGIGAFGAFTQWLPRDQADLAVKLFVRDVEPLWQRLLGFGYHSRSGYPSIANSRSGPPVVVTRVWTVPTWAIVVATGSLPAAALAVRRRKHNRSSQNCCSNCGYDLRATPDRCPECGTATASAK